MVEKYIVIKDGIIIGCFETSQGKAGILASIDTLEHDEIKIVDIEGDHRIDSHIDEYDTNHKFKPMSERVRLGHFKLPENHKLDGEEIVPMTIEDKVREGKMVSDPHLKYVGNDAIAKTDEELISGGVYTKEELQIKKDLQFQLMLSMKEKEHN